MNNKVIVEPGEDGYFVAHVPSLESCWSQGKTREEALENIREAINLYLEPEPTGSHFVSLRFLTENDLDSMFRGKPRIPKPEHPPFSFDPD
jgi:predicted RNase H-like HicB family nuclease